MANVSQRTLTLAAGATAVGLSTLYVAWKLLLAFPAEPADLRPLPSLASLPPNSRHWEIYPEDIHGEGGAYANLPHGRVRYWLLGPEDGKKVVLIHGLSIPSMIWKDVASKLAAHGFRVLLYDLYGRGYSDAPQTTYNASLYLTQLALLMQHAGWNSAYIAGVSMGGGIATAFASTFPQLVDGKVALVCPVGLLKSEHLSFQMKFMASRLVKLLGGGVIARAQSRRLSRGKKKVEPYMELVNIQAEHLPGYGDAIISSLRDGPVRGLEREFTELGKQDTKVLLVWGDDDPTVPYSLSRQVQNLVPQANLVTIHGGQHDITLSHPEPVSDALIEFFSDK